MLRASPTRVLSRALACALCLLASASGGSALADEPRSVVVVKSRDDGPYESVVSGVRGALRGRKDVTLRVGSLEQGGGEAALESVRIARRAATSPLITVGSKATAAALETPGKGAVIACMIVGAHELGRDQNATGVVLEFPIEVQLGWIRNVLPHGQAIGVLYNPAQNEERVTQATRAASRLGLRIVAREVHRPQDLPAALESLAQEADLLLALTDQIVLSPRTAEAILLFSFRNRIPFSGLSASWVKAGALYALERDYEDLGAQCGEMAIRVLDGTAPSSMPPAVPRKVAYALNVRTAEHLKLDLPATLVAGAAQVFR